MIGSIHRLENFESEFVSARHVDIWLPEGYEENLQKRYSVLYMQDGQNLFHPEDSYTGVDWGIVSALTNLIADGKVPETIVVGIWNTEKRWAEYVPQRPFESKKGQGIFKRFTDQFGGEILSDLYLRFIVEELKVVIDQNLRTRSDFQHTAIMGSSMGGLISLYAICEYPQVFGAAGCLSTHWPAVKSLIRDYLQVKLPNPEEHKIYFDFGTRGLDKKYEKYQNRIDRIMEARGYVLDQNWITRKYIGADHNESAWRERVHIPLEFIVNQSNA